MCYDFSNEGAPVNPDKFARFLTSENHQQTDPESANRLMIQLLDDPMRSACGLKFSAMEVMLAA